MILHRAVRKVHSNAGKVSGNDITNIEAYDENNIKINLDISKIQENLKLLEIEENNVVYKQKRALEYPDFREYLDGIVKGDQAQIQAYIDACNAIKAKYPKPGSV